MMDIYHIADYQGKQKPPIAVLKPPVATHGGSHMQITMEIRTDIAMMLCGALAPFQPIFEMYGDKRTQWQRDKEQQAIKDRNIRLRHEQITKKAITNAVKQTLLGRLGYDTFCSMTDYGNKNHYTYSHFRRKSERQELYFQIKARSMIRDKYLRGLSHKAIGKMWGLSTTGVTQCIQRYTKKEAGKRYLDRFPTF